MSCEQTNEYIMKYLDGTLNDIENAQLKQHTKTCMNCRQQFNDLCMIFDALEDAEPIEPPMDFEAQVMKRIASQKAAEKERNANIAAFLYNIALSLSIVLLTAFVINLNNSVSFSGILLMLQDALSGVYDFVFSLFTTFVGINKALLEEYYQLFAALFLLLFAGQQTVLLMKNDRGGTR